MPGSLLTGFDFPIGIPHQYALHSGITDFLSPLPVFGHGIWNQFFFPAQFPSEISIYRPFYPAKPGGSSRFVLEFALGIPFSQLHRLCEMR